MSEVVHPPATGRQFDETHLLTFLKAIGAPSSEEIAQSGMTPIERPNPCTELRIFNATYQNNFIVPANRYSSTLAGWYNDPHALKVDSQRLRGNSGYIIPNPIDPDLMHRSWNKLLKAKKEWATSDADITALRWLFIDIDVKRKSDISATNDEVKRAIGRRDEILAAHSELKRSALWGCSGNGGFILVRIPDYPNDPKHKAMVARFNDAMVAKFSDEKITVDDKTKNPARLMCLPGTMKCKGESKGERVHRMATFDSWAAGNPLIVPSLNLTAWLELHGTAPVVQGKPQNGLVFTNGNGVNGNGHAKPPIAGAGASGTSAAASPIERARACINAMAPAISGQDGHKQLYGVAVTLVDGFGLDYLDALSLFQDWNAAKAMPPEDDAQIVHKLEDAIKNHPVPSLGLLNANVLVHTRAQHAPRLHLNGEHVAGEVTGKKPEVILSPDIETVIDSAERALGMHPDIFQRAGMFVTVVRDKKLPQGVFSDDAAIRIVPLESASVRELMSESADWVSYRPRGEGETESEPKKVMPPDWAAPTLIARKGRRCPTIRYLQAVVDSPVLRRDGTVLDSPGYDAETAILYLPEDKFQTVPSHPNRTQARESANALLDLIAQFPIISDAHRAVWLAALLTPFARFAIDGPCPLFFFDANTPAAGKSKLVDVISKIVLGRDMPRTVYPDTDDEMRKRITSILLAGIRMNLIDNVPTELAFGGASIDAALTGKSWTDRILGKSEMCGDLPLFTIWYGTGNNITIKGDGIRRIGYCRIESKDEKAEQRSGFKYNPLLDHVADHRSTYVTHVLTILRGFCVAGKPKVEGPAMDFPAWSDLVRSAVFWATDIDPWTDHDELRKADPALNNYQAVIEGWSKIEEQSAGVTAAQVLKILFHDKDIGRHEGLRTALMEWSRNGELPNPRNIGMNLKKMKGRRISGKYMHSRLLDGIQRWSVQTVETLPSGSSGSQGAISSPSGVNSVQSQSIASSL